MKAQVKRVGKTKRWHASAVAVCLLLMLPALSSAATFPVDDSRSTVLEPTLPLQWRTLSPSRGDHIMQGTTRVQIRLDTRAWTGKFGRIYMTLPAQANGTLQASWRTQGPLLSGQLNSGSRGLVWSGVVPAASLDDVLTVTIQTDGRLMSNAQLLRFAFEIDLP